MLQTISMTESAIVFNFTGTLYEIVWTVASCTEHEHVTYYMKNVHFCEELKNDGNTVCGDVFYTHLLVVWVVLKFTESVGL